MNIVLTACDQNYFNSFILLLESIIRTKTKTDKVILLDIGLNKNNKDLIDRIDYVDCIDFHREFKQLDQDIGFPYFQNVKTYGFKPYLLKHFIDKLSVPDNSNILYIDSRIKTNI